MTVTIIIVIVTALISIAAFNDVSLLNKLIMWPRAMQNRPQEYYRFLTSGFIHADWNHLIFNMLTLFFFGRNAEGIIGQLYGTAAAGVFVLFYLVAIVLASVPSFIKHRNDSYYRSLGASGGVSAILFFTIYYFPWSKIYIFFVPIGIPAIIYAVLYTIYSAYMSKKGNDNIGHDAHLGGGAFGFIFAFAVDPTHGQLFLNQIMHPVFNG